VKIEYSYAEEFFKDVNKTLIYCKDLVLDVRIYSRMVCHFITSTTSMSHLTLVQPVAVTTLITWLTAPSLVDLSLTVRIEEHRVYLDDTTGPAAVRRHSK